MFSKFKKEIMKKLDNTVKENITNLYNDLVAETPKDTGQMVDDWTKPTKTGELKYRVTNGRVYAPIIWEGNTTQKWESGTVILNRNLLKLKKDLKKI